MEMFSASVTAMLPKLYQYKPEIPDDKTAGRYPGSKAMVDNPYDIR
jgi:hypothetical protein